MRTKQLMLRGKNRSMETHALRTVSATLVARTVYAPTALSEQGDMPGLGF